MLEIDGGEVPLWLGLPLTVLVLFLVVKAYGFIRDREGMNDNSWLEGVGALWLAWVLWPFMPFIWIYRWATSRKRVRRPV